MSNKPKNGSKDEGRNIMLTPPHAIEPLLPLIPKDWTIWESATNHERIMQNAFKNKGYEVVGTDICFGEKYDYFNFDPIFHYDIEVTNVPFSLKYLWIAKALQRGKPFILICPYETSFASAFQKEFHKYNNQPHEIIVLSPERRINYKTPSLGWDGSAQMPTAFITYKLTEQIEAVYSNPLRTFYVPLRGGVKYDENNEEVYTKLKGTPTYPVLF